MMTDQWKGYDEPNHIRLVLAGRCMTVVAQVRNIIIKTKLPKNGKKEVN